jgi:THO complex subunit 3
VEKVLFNPVREFELASCSGDGTVRFWDTKNRTCSTKLDVGGDAFTLAWSVDGTILIVGLKVIYCLLLELIDADTLRMTHS